MKNRLKLIFVFFILFLALNFGSMLLLTSSSLETEMVFSIPNLDQEETIELFNELNLENRDFCILLEDYFCSDSYIDKNIINNKLKNSITSSDNYYSINDFGENQVPYLYYIYFDSNDEAFFEEYFSNMLIFSITEVNNVVKGALKYLIFFVLLLIIDFLFYYSELVNQGKKIGVLKLEGFSAKQISKIITLKSRPNYKIYIVYYIIILLLIFTSIYNSILILLIFLFVYAIEYLIFKLKISVTINYTTKNDIVNLLKQSISYEKLMSFLLVIISIIMVLIFLLVNIFSVNLVEFSSLYKDSSNFKTYEGYTNVEMKNFTFGNVDSEDLDISVYDNELVNKYLYFTNNFEGIYFYAINDYSEPREVRDHVMYSNYNFANIEFDVNLDPSKYYLLYDFDDFTEDEVLDVVNRDGYDFNHIDYKFENNCQLRYDYKSYLYEIDACLPDPIIVVSPNDDIYDGTYISQIFYYKSSTNGNDELQQYYDEFDIENRNVSELTNFMDDFNIVYNHELKNIIQITSLLFIFIIVNIILINIALDIYIILRSRKLLVLKLEGETYRKSFLEFNTYIYLILGFIGIITLLVGVVISSICLLLINYILLCIFIIVYIFRRQIIYFNKYLFKRSNDDSV